jgi:hypothetical protein
VPGYEHLNPAGGRGVADVVPAPKIGTRQIVGQLLAALAEARGSAVLASTSSHRRHDFTQSFDTIIEPAGSTAPPTSNGMTILREMPQAYLLSQRHNHYLRPSFIGRILPSQGNRPNLASR